MDGKGAGLLETLHSPSNTGTDMALIILKQACQSKVGNFGVQIPVQQNVAGFDITVDYTG